jgi:hypothetical protein
VFSREKVDLLLDFLKNFVNFEPRENFLKFEDRIDTLIEKKRPMGIKEAIMQECRYQGIEEGKEEAKSTFVTNLLLKSNFSIGEIAEFVEVSVDFVIGIKNNLPSASN